MNAVGIDIAKVKSKIAILRPLGEIVTNPFEIYHASVEINDLIEHIQDLEGDTRIVMEHTGHYYEPMGSPSFQCRSLR